MDARPDVREHVTAEVAGMLDDLGRFILPEPTSSSGIPIITTGRARELALAYVRSFGRTWKRIWEQRGKVEIDLDAFVLAPDVYFADTPHLPLPERYVREQVYAGPWYVLHFQADGRPRLIVEISAYSTGLVTSDGALPDRVAAHEYFRARAVTSPGESLASPEDAVLYLRDATGAKVAEMPVLVRRNAGWAAAGGSFWRMALDRPVEVVTTERRWNSSIGARSTASVIYVGPGPALLVPAPDQGPVARLPVLTFQADAAESRCIDLPLRPGMVQRYDEVVWAI